MKLLRRNTVRFAYKAYSGETETVSGTTHTGEYVATYSTPVYYRGNISAPYGNATDNLFGINTHYTHVLVMDDPSTPISEDGLIEWNGDTYEVKAVRPTINVLAVALKKRTKNNAPEPTQTTTTQGDG